MNIGKVIHFVRKVTLFPIDDFHFLFNKKKYNSLLLQCPFSPT